jgi:hypothetical protein
MAMKKHFIVLHYFVLFTMLLSCGANNLAQSNTAQTPLNESRNNITKKDKKTPMNSTVDNATKVNDMGIKTIPHGAVFAVGEYSIGNSVGGATTKQNYILPDKSQSNGPVAYFSIWKRTAASGAKTSEYFNQGAGSIIKVGNYSVLIVHVEPRPEGEPQWTNNQGWVAYKVLPTQP